MTTRVKSHELRTRTEAALVEELTKQLKELASLRVSKVSSSPQVKLSKIRVSFVVFKGANKSHIQYLTFGIVG